MVRTTKWPKYKDEFQEQALRMGPLLPEDVHYMLKVSQHNPNAVTRG
jgi:hypothetical protein